MKIIEKRLDIVEFTAVYLGNRKHMIGNAPDCMIYKDERNGECNTNDIILVREYANDYNDLTGRFFYARITHVHSLAFPYDLPGHPYIEILSVESCSANPHTTKGGYAIFGICDDECDPYSC